VNEELKRKEAAIAKSDLEGKEVRDDRSDTDVACQIRAQELKSKFCEFGFATTEQSRKRKQTKFNNVQNNIIMHLYKQKDECGKKVNAEQAHEYFLSLATMSKITFSEVLDASQIRSKFSRIAAGERRSNQSSITAAAESATTKASSSTTTAERKKQSSSSSSAFSSSFSSSSAASLSPFTSSSASSSSSSTISFSPKQALFPLNLSHSTRSTGNATTVTAPANKNKRTLANVLNPESDQSPATTKKQKTKTTKQ